MTDIENIKKYVRAANYLAIAQIYLYDNFLLRHKLAPHDIKPRLLGHWGTCPGINFTYAHLNHLIKKYDAEMMFVLGPGHGFPALQANLYMEGSLKEFYPAAQHNEAGISYIAKNFSWPYGFPSHSNPGAPGVILEGGELGYSLSTSYGAVLDNPNLIVACLVGDGEAETGPMATSWHLNKLVNPATCGAVLPILHLNGYKISGPTFYGRMSDKELTSLFFGYGYDPYIVDSEDEDDIHLRMEKTLERAYKQIREIQKAAKRKAKPSPRFPMIILRTLKGWTGIKELNGVKVEGNYAAHQVVATEAKTDPTQLELVEQWLRSYKFNELFDPKAGFVKEILSMVPKKELRMGMSKHARGGKPVYKPLKLPDAKKFAEPVSSPGVIGSSSMRRAGLFLQEVFKLNKANKNFRLLSPDETYSNKLDEVFKVTKRAFMWPLKPWDKDLAQDGRVMEMLSEHSLQGLMQGYVLTGRHAIFASYEAFVQIVASMADQYAKFISVARFIGWRGQIPSLNYILTSSGWRQEHNGFSHQNPGFIDDMLLKQGCFVNVYFPPCGNSTLVVLKHCMETCNEINIIVAGKTQEPRWLTTEQAEKQFKRGLGIWDFASDKNPDVILAGAGDYLTKECLAAISYIKQDAPEIKVRFINIMSLSSIGIGDTDCHVPFYDFEDFFTHDKPVIFNFHGYPQTLKQLLFDYGNDKNRFSVHGYIENGSTTTPFDMHVRNRTSRFHLLMEVYGRMKLNKVIDPKKADLLIKKYEDVLVQHQEYIKKFGVDPDEIENWTWNKAT